MGCWTELYTFSLVNHLIQSFMILTWLISKQMREDDVSVAARTFFPSILAGFLGLYSNPV